MAAVGSRANEDEPGDSSHTPWHEHDWNSILAGSGTADRYFVRAGLIRKDRLPAFVPEANHPPTAVVRSFEELREAFEALNAGVGHTEGESHGVSFVLKQAHSSNAHGIRFLSLADARSVLDSTRSSQWPAHGSHQVLAASAMGLGAAVAAIACLVKTSDSMKRSMLCIAMLSATLGLTTLGRAGLPGTADTALGIAQQEVAQTDLIDSLKKLLHPTISNGQGKATVWVLQRHITPWLHEGRKFHLRVLLMCVGDLRAFVHENVRVLVATEPFRLGEHDCKNLLALVSNMGASRRSSMYDEGGQNLPLTALGEDLAKRVFGEVVEVLGTTLARLRTAGRRQFFTMPNCWELFGADLLIEGETGRAILLEVNPSPSLAMYGTGTGMRAKLCGPNPLESIPHSWHEAALKS